MSTKKIFTLTFIVITFLICVMGVASVLMLKETIITLAFKQEADAAAIEQTVRILQERINAFREDMNVRGGRVEYQAPNIVVRLRGYTDLSAFAEVLTMPGQVRLCLAADEEAERTANRTGRMPQGYEQRVLGHEFIRLQNWREKEVHYEPILLKMPPEMVLGPVKAARIDFVTIQRRPVVTIEFNEADSHRFAEIAREHDGRRLALLVDNDVYVAPQLKGDVPDGIVHIQNIVLIARARRLYDMVRIGALPVPLQVVAIELPEGIEQASEPAGQRRIAVRQ